MNGSAVVPPSSVREAHGGSADAGEPTPRAPAETVARTPVVRVQAHGWRDRTRARRLRTRQARDRRAHRLAPERRADLRDLSGGLHGGRHDGERVRAVAGAPAPRSRSRRAARRTRSPPSPGRASASRPPAALPSPPSGIARWSSSSRAARRASPSRRTAPPSASRASCRTRPRPRRRPVRAGRAWRCAAPGGCAEGSSGRRGRCRWLRCRSEAWPDCAPTPPVPRWARRNIGVSARFQPRIRWLQWRARGVYAAPDRCHIMRGLRLSVTVGWRTCRNGSHVPHLDRTKPGRTRPGGPNGRTCQ